MPMTKQLVVRLRPDGTVDAETVGMRGSECLDHIQELENLLEATTTSSRFTEDYAAAPLDEVQGASLAQEDDAR